MQLNVQKYNGETSSLPYDYNSIVHYGIMDFYRDCDQPTILPKKRDANIGNRDVMSAGDVQKLNLLYRCNAPKETTTTASSLVTSPIDPSHHSSHENERVPILVSTPETAHPTDGSDSDSRLSELRLFLRIFCKTAVLTCMLKQSGNEDVTNHNREIHLHYCTVVANEIHWNWRILLRSTEIP